MYDSYSKHIRKQSTRIKNCLKKKGMTGTKIQNTGKTLRIQDVSVRETIYAQKCYRKQMLYPKLLHHS